jgi:hypothetical protein
MEKPLPHEKLKRVSSEKHVLAGGTNGIGTLQLAGTPGINLA